MPLLTEIHRSEGVNVNGKTILREAVRAVILDEHKLLLVYSPVNGDYKFPGGGVNSGETHEQALIREVREECGVNTAKIMADCVGSIIEYDIPVEVDFDVFKMISYYYFCQVDEGFGAQALDGYEADLGFKPVWVNIDEAILNNKQILQNNAPKIPEWLKREIFMLEYVNNLFKK